MNCTTLDFKIIQDHLVFEHFHFRKSMLESLQMYLQKTKI